MDVEVLTDERRSFTDGEVVWSWRPDAGAKFARMLSQSARTMVARKPVTRESPV